MISRIITIILVLQLFNPVHSQENLLIERDEMSVLKANISTQHTGDLVVGHSYNFEVIASDNYDIKLKANNAILLVDSSSLRNTGPFRFSLTPTDTGEISICASVILGEKRQASLFCRIYKAVRNYSPKVFVSKKVSGSTLKKSDLSNKITCNLLGGNYNNKNLEVDRWILTFGDKQFKGTENILPQEVIDFLSKKNGFFKIDLFLKSNSFDIKTCQGVFIIEP